MYFHICRTKTFVKIVYEFIYLQIGWFYEKLVIFGFDGTLADTAPEFYIVSIQQQLQWAMSLLNTAHSTE